MIQKMRKYNYSKLTDKLDEYGQPIQDSVTGEVLMFISDTTQSPVQNPLYAESEYTGLCRDNTIDDKCTIEYEDKKLKVLYVVKGRYNQVFMKRCE